MAIDGALLVDPSSPRVLLDFAPVGLGASPHTVAIPADAALIGMKLTVQGVRLGAGAELSANAIDLLSGL